MPQLQIPPSSFSIDYRSRQMDVATECEVENPFLPKELQKGRAIWDTGATASVISPRMVRSLELVATGKAIVQGVHSKEEVNTYIINLFLPEKTVINGLPVSEAYLGEKTDILIGMNVIGIGDFAICGGRFFSYATPSLERPIDFVR